MPTWTARLQDKCIEASSEQLIEFRNCFVADQNYSGRVSELLLFDMFVWGEVYGISPREIIAAIETLERDDLKSGTKAAAPFLRRPLKGLWHKHFFSARFFAQNMLNSLHDGSVENILREVMDPSRSDVFTQGMADEIAHRVTHEPIRNRYKSGRMTGEWIIFLKAQTGNIYLCLAPHSADDQSIYDRIVKHCVREFPDLPRRIEQSAQSIV